MAKLVAAGLAVDEAAPDVSRARDAFLPIRAFQFAALFRENASYVFFRELTGEGPLGAMNVALTPGTVLK